MARKLSRAWIVLILTALLCFATSISFVEASASETLAAGTQNPKDSSSQKAPKAAVVNDDDDDEILVEDLPTPPNDKAGSDDVADSQVKSSELPKAPFTAEWLKALQSVHEFDEGSLFVTEVVLMMFAMAYTILHLIGRFVNGQVMRDLGNAMILAAQKHEFPHIGVQDIEELQRKPLFKDGADFAYFYATGRTNAPFGLTVGISMYPRHDFFGMLKSTMFKVANDSLHVIMPLDLRLQPLVILICREQDLLSYRKAHPDIDMLCDRYPLPSFLSKLPLPAGLSEDSRSDLAFATDSSDATTLLQVEKISSALVKLRDSLVVLHITDQGSNVDLQSMGYKKLLLMTIDLGSSPHLSRDEVVDLTMAVTVSIADAVVKFDNIRNPMVMERVKALRKKAEEESMKEVDKKRKAEAAEKKQEKREEEKSLDPEEQAKLEEKRRKKELRKRQSSGAIKILR